MGACAVFGGIFVMRVEPTIALPSTVTGKPGRGNAGATRGGPVFLAPASHSHDRLLMHIGIARAREYQDSRGTLLTEFIQANSDETDTVYADPATIRRAGTLANRNRACAIHHNPFLPLDGARSLEFGCGCVPHHSAFCSASCSNRGSFLTRTECAASS